MKKTILSLICLMIMGTVTSSAKTTVIISSHSPNREFVIAHESNVKKDAKLAKKHHKEMEKRKKEMEKRHKKEMKKRNMKAHKAHAKHHKHSHCHHH